VDMCDEVLVVLLPVVVDVFAGDSMYGMDVVIDSDIVCHTS
jgi:hypothetical protein